MTYLFLSQPYIWYNGPPARDTLDGYNLAYFSMIGELTGIHFEYFGDKDYVVENQTQYVAELSANGSDSFQCGNWGIAQPGSCSAMMFNAANDANLFSLTKQIVLSGPFLDSQGGIFAKKQKKTSTTWRLFNPFTLSLWIGVTGVNFITAGLIVVLSKLRGGAETEEPNADSGILSLFSAFVSSLYSVFAMLAGKMACAI